MTALLICSLAVTLLVQMASANNALGLFCTSSSTCPEGSMCVDNKCHDCSCERLQCLKNTEACGKLTCKNDEGCYLQEDADFNTNVVTLKVVCAKKNPCQPGTCSRNYHCVPTSCGLQPPYARCENRFIDECNSKSCANGQTCVLNFAFCYGVPCRVEPVCADVSQCLRCGYGKYCDLIVQDGNTGAKFKGVCVSYHSG